MVRRDRNRNGGGVCIILRDHFAFSVPDTRPSSEICCVDLFLSTSHVRLVCAYRPPNYDTSKTEQFVECLSDFCSSCSHPILIAGDFNSDALKPPTSPSGRCLNDFISSVPLTHCLLSPTRKNHCLDWVIATHPSLVSKTCVIPAFPSSDHEGVSFLLEGHALPPAASPVRDYCRANFDEMNSFFRTIKWEELLVWSLSVDDLYDRFLSILQRAIEQFVPFRTPRPPSAAYPPHIQKLIAYRNKLFLKISDPAFREKYSLTSSKLLKEVSKWEKYCQRQKLAKMPAVYRHVSSLIRAKPSPPRALLNPNGCPVVGTAEKASLLSSEFASSFTDDDGLPPPQSGYAYNALLKNFTIFPSEVFNSLRKLKPSGSCGADGIPQILFSKCASSLSLPLADIFNFCLEHSVTPKLWKHALITALPKPGKDPALPSSYRPISILSPAAKTLERVVRTHLLAHLSRLRLLPDYQHGFRAGASVTTNLLACEDAWTKALSDGESLDVIYLDFSRAFDTVSIPKLLTKCERMGIGGPFLSWLESFLNDRTFPFASLITSLLLSR